MKKIFLFLILCLISQNITIAQELKKKDKKKIIASVSDLLITNYVFEENAISMSKLLEKNQQNGKYKSFRSTKDFISALVSDIRSVNNDQHLDIYYRPKENNQPENNSSLPKSLLEERGSKNNYGLKEVKILDGNIGYINVSNFSLGNFLEQAKIAVSSAMSFVKNTDALILDMKNNPGGSNDLTIYLLSYFFSETKQPLWDAYHRPSNKTTKFNTVKTNGEKYLNKPLYILLDNGSFSAPEAFAYSLKHYEMATVIGEKSYGGAHPSLVYKINDEFSILIPTSRIINPITKTDWEQKGVTPNIETSSKKALITAQIIALEKLNELNKRVEYENYIKTLNSIKEPLIIDEAILSNYLGKYELAKDRHLTITKNCEFLFGQMTGDNNKIKLIALDKTSFKAENMDAQIKFNMAEEGIVNGLTFSIGNNNMEATKTE